MPRIRAAVVAYDANAGMLVDHEMPMILASCLEDGWPDELKRCIVDATPDALAHEHACEKLVPDELWSKAAKRFGVSRDSLP